MPEKSREELVAEIRALRAQLEAFEVGRPCWDTDQGAPCVAQQRLAGILTIADDAIISVDDEQRITLFNQGAERIFGYEAHEVLGQPIHMLLPERFREAHAKYLAAFSEGPNTSREMGSRGQVWGLRKDGTEFPAEASISRVTIGQETVLTVILRDITERRRVEAALAQARDQAIEASRVKSAFLANMSHEIRTPMNGVIGMIELLLDSPLNDMQREYVQIMHESAQSLLTIINDILDFSKIEAGKLQLEIVDFEPLALVEGVAELLASKAREKGLSLMTYVDPALPAVLRGDPIRLRQILLNLGDNAIKFTDKGEVVIKATQKAHDNEHVVVEFSVRDTGIGLSDDAREWLFEPFVQAEGSAARPVRGTGLGLSISKRLVDLMHGHIGVESKLGKGSTFWFRVPLETAKDPAPRAVSPREVRVSDIKALIVDDNETARTILSSYLDSWGIANVVAENSKEALSLLLEAAAADEPFDLAIVDLRMPDGDGLALGREIRRHGELRSLRLILLTAFDAHGQGERALEEGFSAYMTKPVRQSHLFDCIINLLAGRQPVSALAPAGGGPVPTLKAAERPQYCDRRILLAEDNPVNQRVVLLQLERLGYPVDAVSNGEEAVRAVAEKKYDLILMDCQMPVMDGFQATQAIRKAEVTTGRRIPIIALTANAMQGDRERCLSSGMDDYLSKPVSPSDLKAMLERWLNRSSTDAAADSSAPAIDALEFDGEGDDASSDVTASATSAAAGEPLDLGALYAEYGPDKGRVEQILRLYVSTTARLLEQIQEALAQRAAEACRGAAHELKGASLMIGADEMSDVCLALERAATARDWERADALMDRLTQAYERLAKFLPSV